MKAAFYLPLVGIALLLVQMLWMFMRNRAMKQRQKLLIKQLQGRRYWRINLARPSFSARWLRLLPFEAKGVLIDEGDSYRLQGHWAKTGAAFDSVSPKASATLKWVGKHSPWANNLYWLRLDTPEGQVLLCADTGLYAPPSRQALCDMLRGAFPGFPLAQDNKARDFALEKNPRSLCATALILGLLLFALLDSYVISNYELVDAQLRSIVTTLQFALALPMGLIALVALCYRFFRAGHIPARESLLLAVMLCLIGAGATFPVLKRVDQLLAQAPAQTYSYRLSGASGLKPLDPALDLPPLQFPRMKEYWQQLPPGSTYPVPLLRGPMGLWQLDHARFDPPIIAFYEKQARKQPGR